MKFSSQIKPISYLKAHAAEVVRELTEQREPLVITQNGEAKVVIQDVKSYEETQEALALLKLLALGNRQIEEGKVQEAGDVIARLRNKVQLAGDPACFGGCKGLVEGGWGMGIEIIHHPPDHLCCREIDIDQQLHLLGKVLRGAPRGHINLAPSYRSKPAPCPVVAAHLRRA
jgi:prevent-host-death family protein